MYSTLRSRIELDHVLDLEAALLDVGAALAARGEYHVVSGVAQCAGDRDQRLRSAEVVRIRKHQNRLHIGDYRPVGSKGRLAPARLEIVAPTG